MAISETMSNYSDWMQLYQNNFAATQVETPPAATATATEAAAATYSAGTSTSRNNLLIPDQGRISKPVRRRSRASRQTPTTLLNTDITNFRAMVQHFTGGPATRPQLPGGGSSITQQAPGGGFYVQYPNQFQQQQQQQAFLSSVNSRRGGSGNGGGGAPSHPPPPGSSSVNDDGDHDSYML